tara:strand:- start:65947 stop:66381 length:435 start_codon:yes stop_codon:yes gene_type:complete
MKIKIINKSNTTNPSYSTNNSAGLDLRAHIKEEINLNPMSRVLIKTGLFIQLPEGYEAQIRPRSGLAYKNGITVLNTPGTIDADYRGEVGVLLINLSNDSFKIKNGDRIAQMVIAKYEQAEWISVEQLDTTQRGDGGFGSTGII